MQAASLVPAFSRNRCFRAGKKYVSLLACQMSDGFPERGVLEQHRDLAPKLHNREWENAFGAAGKSKDTHEALSSFCRTIAAGAKPTRFTLCTVLSSCAKNLNLCLGLQIHANIIRSGHKENLILSSALVDLYAKCGATEDAKRVFDGMLRHDQVSWTSIISGFSQNGRIGEAISMFKKMLATHIRPNCFTYASVISACVGLQEAFEECILLHAHVIKLGLDGNSFVLSSLIDCYSKHGRIDYAALLFNETTRKDIVLLNSMISGYTMNFCNDEALRLFTEARHLDLTPTDHTLTSTLNACGSLTVLEQGKQVHSLIIKMGSESNVFVITALIDMYAKCGSIHEASRVFYQTSVKNRVLWTSMIMGYAQSGQAADALELFERFVTEENYVPDHICFTAVLTACNHAGLLDEGEKYFNEMRRDYGLVPELDQYACLIDLYARYGHLSKAKDLMEEMPCDANYVMWSSFLGACNVYGNVELGREAANQLFKMEPHNAAPYVTLASIYSKAGLWGEAAKVKKWMHTKGIRKSAGWSWIEVDKTVHVFSAVNTGHLQAQEIYLALEKLNMEMKEAGYLFKQHCESDDIFYE